MLARTIEGEVEAVEYLEVFTGCFHCKTKTRNAGPGLISRSKCGTLMKERRGQHKVAAHVLLLDILTEQVSTITMFEEQVQSKYASSCAGVKYLSFSENCATSTAVDVGVVSQEEVGDPEDVDFVPARTIKGEVDHKYRNSTTLSTYVWSLKDSTVGYTMKWSIHRRAAAYSNISKKCNMCLAEKLAIIDADKSKSLYHRRRYCRHSTLVSVLNLFVGVLCGYPPFMFPVFLLRFSQIYGFLNCLSRL